MTGHVSLCRLSIYLGNAHVVHHKNVGSEIVLLAHRSGLRGVTTLHGTEGFGHSAKTHDQPRWRIVDRSPVTVHIVDSGARIDAFLPQLADLAGDCLIVRDEVTVLQSGGEQS